MIRAEQREIFFREWMSRGKKKPDPFSASEMYYGVLLTAAVVFIIGYAALVLTAMLY